MTYTRLRVSLLAAAATVLLALSAASAAAAAPQPEALLGLQISGLPAGQDFSIQFDSGTVESNGKAAAEAQAGAISNIVFNGSRLLVGSAPGGSALNAFVTDSLHLPLGENSVTGTASVPAGTTVTASFGDETGVPIPNGRFSLRSGGLGTPPPGTALAVTCSGTSQRCLARIPIAAGTSTRRLTVRLPARGLTLHSIGVAPGRLGGKYALTRSHYARGGRTWDATLDVAKAPRGAHLTLIFTR